MALFSDGICCGTCKHFTSDQRGDIGCSLHGSGVIPRFTKLCIEWEPANKSDRILPKYFAGLLK